MQEEHQKRGFTEELKLLVERYGLKWTSGGNR
jgi:hypothetical protein